MGMLASVAVGILVVAIVFMLAPTIPFISLLRLKLRAFKWLLVWSTDRSHCEINGVKGGKMETAMPALAADSEWNATYNTGLTTGADKNKTHNVERLFSVYLGGIKSLPHGGGPRDYGGRRHFRASGCEWRVNLLSPWACHTSGPPSYGGIA